MMVLLFILPSRWEKNKRQCGLPPDGGRAGS